MVRRTSITYSKFPRESTAVPKRGFLQRPNESLQIQRRPVAFIKKRSSLKEKLRSFFGRLF